MMYWSDLRPKYCIIKKLHILFISDNISFSIFRKCASFTDFHHNIKVVYHNYHLYWFGWAGTMDIQIISQIIRGYLVGVVGGNSPIKTYFLAPCFILFLLKCFLEFFQDLYCPVWIPYPAIFPAHFLVVLRFGMGIREGCLKVGTDHSSKDLNKLQNIFSTLL